RYPSCLHDALPIYPRPVLGGIEPLLDRDGLGVEHQLRLREHGRLARRDVQPIDRRGAIEAGEAIERLRVARLAGEPADAADPAELHRRELAALEVERARQRARILEVRQDQPIADDRGAVDRLLGLGYHFAPVAAGAVEID